MARIVIGVEYDGSGFCGWQWQPQRRSVQGELEKALTRVANRPISVVCAGRTDAGVHALEQIAHFDTQVTRHNDAWLLGGNSHLPDDIRILWASPVTNEFNARYSALARLYRYVINNRPVNSALIHRQTAWCYRPLNAEAMHAAAQHLIGHHDFSSFRAQGCQSKSPFRQMHFIDVRRENDTVIMSICANAFLHHMVRNIAGVLIDIGAGKQSETWPLKLLDLKKREAAGITAPASGLYLESVYYPVHFGFAKHPAFDKLPDDIKRFN